MHKVMAEEDIIREYGVTSGFIARHSRAMGCYFHRPRRFLRSDVEAFFVALAQRSKDHLTIKKQTAVRNKIAAKKIADIVLIKRAMRRTAQ